MNKNKQFYIIIFVVIILIITSLLALWLSNSIDDDEKNNPNNGGTTAPSITQEITRLDNYDTFFSIQDAINNFYSSIYNNKEKALEILDKDYIFENGVNINNLESYFPRTYEVVNFIAEEIYYNQASEVIYYFVKGYTTDTTMDEPIIYKDNIYYLLIRKNNKYIIKPLNNINDLESYAKEYNKVDININNNETFSNKTTSETNKLISYIANYKNLVLYDTNKAYEMLADDMKNIYPNENSLRNDRINIANKLFTAFYSTGNIEYEDYIVYKIQDNSYHTITITEYYPNDYKISFNY